jgi:pimeloyl-ACP methyl ester carboxylesterase
MPHVERAGAKIYYEVHGRGFPLLLLAPGGLNSTITFWERLPLRPLEVFQDEFQVIAMDQRNADRSSGPLDTGDPWGMYCDDQVAVLDQLGIEKALMIGCCIGCSFILEMVKRHPDRIQAGVMMQPIGEDETNPGYFGPDMWRPWGEALIEKGASFAMADVDAFGHGLFDSGFAFSVDREFLKTIKTPLLLLDGDDKPHPKSTSEEIAALVPGVQRVEKWRDEASVASATERMREFLRANTPVTAG